MHVALGVAIALCAGSSTLAVVLGAVLRLHADLPLLWVEGFTAILALALVFLGTGYFLQLRAPRVSLGLIGFSLFGCLSMGMTVLNASLMPLRRPRIDDSLAMLDAAVGLEWEAVVLALGSKPYLVALLGAVYGSHLIQLSAMILTVAVLGERIRMAEMIVTAVFCSSLTLGFWALWPSFGPSAMGPLSPEVDLILGSAISAHAEFMIAGAKSGVTRMTLDNLAGLVAFPSFHIIMALIATWYVKGTRLFIPLVLFNTLMVPATVVHGAHHAVDLLGGFFVFVAGVFLSRWTLSHVNRTHH